MLSLRWRAVVVTAVALVVTAPFLPWGSYFDQFSELSAALDKQSVGGLSATALPWLLPVARHRVGVVRARAGRMAGGAGRVAGDAVVLLDAGDPGVDPGRPRR